MFALGERRENERAGEGRWGSGLKPGVLSLLLHPACTGFANNLLLGADTHEIYFTDDPRGSQRRKLALLSPLYISDTFSCLRAHCGPHCLFQQHPPTCIEHLLCAGLCSMHYVYVYRCMESSL